MRPFQPFRVPVLLYTVLIARLLSPCVRGMPTALDPLGWPQPYEAQAALQRGLYDPETVDQTPADEEDEPAVTSSAFITPAPTTPVASPLPPVTPDANGLGPGVIAAIVVAALVTAGVLAGAVGVAFYPSLRAYLARVSHDH